MKYLKYLTLIVFIAWASSCSDSDKDENMTHNKPVLPKKELRGVWMATAWGIDWPMNDYNSATQKQKYIDYLNLFAQNNINAVFMQIRGMADAFYESQYESWSPTLTGTAGQAPDYDVMKFLVDEAHKRGIQFHAWLNPYRIATRPNKSAQFPALDPKIPAAQIKDYEKIRIYNPAMPEVQDRITRIVKEIIAKYNVDGIHIDDYFYPALEASEKMNDDAEYATYGQGKFADIAEFRRNNVNTVVKNIQKTIIETRPEVVFSVSPAANNEYNYATLYADVVKWSQEGWADAVIPQLYFATGASESGFNQRLHWWSQFTYKSHLLVGYGIYKFGDPAAGDKFQSAEDLKKQFEFADTKHKVKGSILYSAKYLTENRVAITDALKEIYKNPAIAPYLGRTAPELPATPANVKVNGSNLTWSASGGAYYAVYKNNGMGKTADLMGTTSETTFKLNAKGSYFVTALDARNAESELSETVVY